MSRNKNTNECFIIEDSFDAPGVYSMTGVWTCTWSFAPNIFISLNNHDRNRTCVTFLDTLRHTHNNTTGATDAESIGSKLEKWALIYCNSNCWCQDSGDATMPPVDPYLPMQIICGNLEVISMWPIVTSYGITNIGRYWLTYLAPSHYPTWPMVVLSTKPPGTAPSHYMGQWWHRQLGLQRETSVNQNNTIFIHENVFKMSSAQFRPFHSDSTMLFHVYSPS